MPYLNNHALPVVMPYVNNQALSELDLQSAMGWMGGMQCHGMQSVEGGQQHVNLCCRLALLIDSSHNCKHGRSSSLQVFFAHTGI